MENDILVLSPEKVVLSFPLGGIGLRALAHMVDAVVVIVTLIAAAIGVFEVLGALDTGLAEGIVLFFTFAIPLGYFILLEGLWNGQTLGKKMVNLRVRMADGTAVTFAAALGRNLIRPADMIPGPYFVGLLAMFMNSRTQRLGDLVANTVVCQERRPEPRFSITPHSVGVHPLEQYVGDLRGMTVEEYNALRRFADRFPELPPAVQNRLVEEVWSPVAQRRKIPSLQNVHPIYLAEAVVMKYGREHGLL